MLCFLREDKYFVWSHHSWRTVTKWKLLLDIFFSPPCLWSTLCAHQSLASRQVIQASPFLRHLTEAPCCIWLIFLQTSNICYKSLNIDLMVTCISVRLYLLFWRVASNLFVVFFFLWIQFILQSMRKFTVSSTTDLSYLL